MPRTPTRDELAALDKALPFGLPWRDAVLSGQPYPPPGGAPAPATCEIPGDRGRLYPGIYFARTTHGKRQCIDCHHAYLLEKRINFARWCALDGATDGHQTPQTRAEAEAYYSVFAPEEESPSAAAIEALRNAVPTGEEGITHYAVEGCELPSEKIDDLKREIAEFQAGQAEK